MTYICIEDLGLSSGESYKQGDMISEDVYYYLQPNEREYFAELYER